MNVYVANCSLGFLTSICAVELFLHVRLYHIVMSLVMQLTGDTIDTVLPIMSSNFADQQVALRRQDMLQCPT